VRCIAFAATVSNVHRLHTLNTQASFDGSGYPNQAHRDLAAGLYFALSRRNWSSCMRWAR